ncbi:MAG: hypothetical protein J0M33_13590 [Anaerolineae bacterium]|nr:hypothetical protein [Anaerolineae bacterium]
MRLRYRTSRTCDDAAVFLHPCHIGQQFHREHRPSCVVQHSRWVLDLAGNPIPRLAYLTRRYQSSILTPVGHHPPHIIQREGARLTPAIPERPTTAVEFISNPTISMLVIFVQCQDPCGAVSVATPQRLGMRLMIRSAWLESPIGQQPGTL